MNESKNAGRSKHAVVDDPLKLAAQNKETQKTLNKKEIKKFKDRLAKQPEFKAKIQAGINNWKEEVEKKNLQNRAIDQATGRPIEQARQQVLTLNEIDKRLEGYEAPADFEVPEGFREREGNGEAKSDSKEDLQQCVDAIDETADPLLKAFREKELRNQKQRKAEEVFKSQDNIKLKDRILKERAERAAAKRVEKENPVVLKTQEEKKSEEDQLELTDFEVPEGWRDDESGLLNKTNNLNDSNDNERIIRIRCEMHDGAIAEKDKMLNVIVGYLAVLGGYLYYYPGILSGSMGVALLICMGVYYYYLSVKVKASQKYLEKSFR